MSGYDVLAASSCPPPDLFDVCNTRPVGLRLKDFALGACPLFFANRSYGFVTRRAQPATTQDSSRIWGVVMRTTVLATAFSLCLVGLCSAQHANASIRKDTNIPSEPLGSALETLAKDYDFQVLYRTEIVKDRKTQG